MQICAGNTGGVKNPAILTGFFNFRKNTGGIMRQNSKPLKDPSHFFLGIYQIPLGDCFEEPVFSPGSPGPDSYSGEKTRSPRCHPKTPEQKDP